MATGGSGDVLTGIITALLCQGLSPFDAARLGAHVHGLAGDLAAAELGQVSLIASDLIDYLAASVSIDRLNHEACKHQPTNSPLPTSDLRPLRRCTSSAISPISPPRPAAAPWRSATSTACIADTSQSCSGCWSGPASVGGPAIVFTFDPHPVRLLRPEQCPPPLTWTERKAELLAALGVDWIVAYPTDEALLAPLGRRVLPAHRSRRARRPRARRRARTFTSATIARARSTGSRELTTVGRHLARRCRSGRSRRRDRLQLAGPRLAAGRQRRTGTQAARRPVSHPRHGHARRRPRREDRLPDRQSGRDRHAAPRPRRLRRPCVHRLVRRYPAALNLGPSPTFGDATNRVEVHVIGLDDPLYGQPMEVDFLARLRDIRPFDSVDALVRTTAPATSPKQNASPAPTTSS